MVIFIMGLPGSGKTFLAKRLAKATGMIHLNSDKTRNKMDKMGKYDAQTKKAVYEQLRQDMVESITEREDVIVDATFYKSALRDLFSKAAEKAGAKCFFVLTTAREKRIEERINKERPDSEADFNVYQKIKKIYEPIEVPHLVVPTDQWTVEQMINRIQRYIKREKDD